MALGVALGAALLAAAWDATPLLLWATGLALVAGGGAWWVNTLRHGIDVEVVDLRTIVPLDDATVAASVRKTGRCVVVSESQGFAGVAGELAARVSEQ